MSQKRFGKLPWRLAIAWLLLAVPRAALACGPDFDEGVLDNRDKVLTGLSRGDPFAEATRLLQPTVAVPCLVRDPLAPTAMPPRPDLPDGRLYDLGAIAYRRSDWALAIQRFRSVLALAPAQRRGYSVAAAFMLGRLHAPEGRPWFVQARELARTGYDDPLCLSTASLGEEGRQALHRKDDAAALRLYLEQYGAGEPLAVSSMRVVARILRLDEARLRRAMHDPVVQQWLAARSYVEGKGYWHEEGEGDARTLRILAELPVVQGADRLAAGAWMQGDFALAERFAPKSRSALGLWVQAKMAMRHGRKESVRALLEAAVQVAHPKDDLVLRLRQDLAVLALGEGRYEDAALLGCRIEDRAIVAHVVEQVLPTDVALRFVGRPDIAAAFPVHPTAVVYQKDPAYVLAAVSPPKLAPRDYRNGDMPGIGIEWLRYLLGRRLLREGRGREGLPYFPEGLQRRVAGYLQALEDVPRYTGIDRARALRKAAHLLHPDGMFLAGTELAPDWTAYPRYARGYGMESRSYPAYHEWETVDWQGPNTEGCRVYLGDAVPDMASAGPCLRTYDEETRVAQHRLTVRYHYRVTKSEMLEQAADLVPKHTQAFAALLCEAAQPVFNMGSGRVSKMWGRYVREGALVPGLFTEGLDCPEPDFGRARVTPPPSWWWRTMRPIKREWREISQRSAEWREALSTWLAF